MGYLVIALAFYFLPAIVAYERRHNSGAAILALNVLLGWTALGWILALVWAFTGNTRRRDEKLWRALNPAPPAASAKDALVTRWEHPRGGKRRLIDARD